MPISRREWLAGAGAGAAALLIDKANLQAQPASAVPSCSRNTTVVERGRRAERRGARRRRRQDRGDRADRSDPQDAIRNADVYDGRGKAIFPGLINCHAHMTATLQRGFNEDFGFPNSAKLAGAARQPAARRRSDADGDGRRARGDSHRDDDVRREHRRHRPLRRRAVEDGTALGVRRIDPRQRERAGSDVAGRTREERDAALLAEAARRGHAAHQRPVHAPGTARTRAASACFPRRR